MIVSTSSKVPTDDCFNSLLISDSALQLYFSESMTRSQNFTEFVVILSLFYCVSQTYF